jgi:Spy/CpxP family protein refolding chaperone
VWGLALFGLVACAGFLAREGGTQVSAAPALALGSPAQTSPQSATASQVAQPGARTGATPSPATPGEREPGSGHGPGWEWWKDDAVKKEIGLRPNQAADIDRIYQRRLKEMDPVVQAYVQERAALVKMIADRVVDDTQLDLEFTKFDALRLKMDASHALMLYRISKVLDTDQYAKLRAISDRRDALQAGRRGRGGASAPRPLGLPR